MYNSLFFSFFKSFKGNVSVVKEVVIFFGIILLWGLSFSVQGQHAKLRIQTDSLNALAEKIVYKDIILADSILNQSLKYAIESNYVLGEARARYYMGVVHFIHGNNEKAIKYFFGSLQCYEEETASTCATAGCRCCSGACRIKATRTRW